MDNKIIDLVPYLDDIDIELKAQELTKEYYKYKKTNQEAPVPVIDILEYLGYDIDFRNDGIYEDESILGGLVIEKKKVQLNESLTTNEGRLNFTIAHEIGHIILHAPLADINKNLFRKDNYCDDNNLKKQERLIERQADKFAAFLLMPSILVKKTFFRTFKKPLNVSRFSIKDFFMRRKPKNKAFYFASKILQKRKI